jgi:hypothetical protein
MRRTKARRGDHRRAASCWPEVNPWIRKHVKQFAKGNDRGSDHERPAGVGTAAAAPQKTTVAATCPAAERSATPAAAAPVGSESAAVWRTTALPRSAAAARQRLRDGNPATGIPAVATGLRLPAASAGVSLRATPGPPAAEEAVSRPQHDPGACGGPRPDQRHRLGGQLAQRRD